MRGTGKLCAMSDEKLERLASQNLEGKEESWILILQQ